MVLISWEMMLTLIEFINLTKIYPNGLTALSNINLKIEKGEFLFIVGASGAGKSTLIKLLLREILPTSGTVLVNGKNLANMKRREIPHLRKNMGVVFQDFRLLNEKTVYENVAFAMEVIEAGRKEIRRQVPMVLSMVGLSSKANMLPSQLSGGEQQRVALARAIGNNPMVLIADEPTGNLDPDRAWDIINLLNEINCRGTTVIMATHAKEIVNSMRKRVVTFNKGVIVKDRERGEYPDEN